MISKLKNIAFDYYSMKLRIKILFSLLYGSLLGLILVTIFFFDHSLEIVELLIVFCVCTGLFFGISVILQIVLTYAPAFLQISNSFISKDNLIDFEFRNSKNKFDIFNNLVMIHFIIILLIVGVLISAIWNRVS